MRWPLSTRAIQLSLNMSALRVDWTLSGVRHSSYSPSKNTWASMRKRSWIQLDQQSSRHPRRRWLTKRSLSWDVGIISVHTMFSAAPDKAQKGPSRSRTWNNRTTQRRHHKKANGVGPDIASPRMLAIQKRVLRGSPRQTGQFRCKNCKTMLACGTCFGVFRSLNGMGEDSAGHMRPLTGFTDGQGGGQRASRLLLHSTPRPGKRGGRGLATGGDDHTRMGRWYLHSQWSLRRAVEHA